VTLLSKHKATASQHKVLNGKNGVGSSQGREAHHSNGPMAKKFALGLRGESGLWENHESAGKNGTRNTNNGRGKGRSITGDYGQGESRRIDPETGGRTCGATQEGVLGKDGMTLPITETQGRADTC